MTRFHRALAALILLASCGPRDARYDVSRFSVTGAAAPPEIVLPAGFEPGARFGGVATLKPDSEAFCCPAAGRIDVPVRKDEVAGDLVVGTYVPTEVGPAERLRVTFPDGSTRTASAPRGFGISRLALPAALRDARGPQRIRIDATNAPYTLVSIYFE